MSIHVISDVLRRSQAKHGARLVLIVLADHAKRDGTGAWPSVATIAEEANLGERVVQGHLRQLEAIGEIASRGPHAAHGTTVYDVLVGGADIAPGGGAESAPGGVHNGAGRGADIAPKPSGNRPAEPSVTRESAPLSFALHDFLEAAGAKPADVGRRWAEAERLLLERDGRDRAEAYQVLQWVFIGTDDDAAFWRGNIHSMVSFRAKYDQLKLQRDRHGAPRPPAAAQVHDV